MPAPLAAVFALGVGLAQDPRASATVRVVDPHGGPIPYFTVALRNCRDDGVLVPADHPELVVQPRMLTGDAFLLGDLPRGEFVLRVDSPGFARAQSQRFAVLRDTQPEVVASMSRGGAIRGRIVDEAGVAVQGARVFTTDEWEVLSDLIPSLAEQARRKAPRMTSSAAATTDAKGNFELSLLAHGAYLLRVEHPKFAEIALPEMEVSDGKPIVLGDLQLLRGCRVKGSVVERGGPFYVHAREDRSGKDPLPMSLWIPNEACTDAQGNFTLPKSLPPGAYVLTFRPRSEDAAIFLRHSLAWSQRLHIKKDEQWVSLDACRWQHEP